mgnify:FL=1
MKKKEHIVKTVKPGSIAEELEIAPGDKVLAIDNTEIEDIFDYQFLTQDTYIEMLVEKPDGEQWLLEIDKEFDEDMGIEFENGLMDEYRHCHNKCIFCFIDQMPKGMRDTLYFKDDDSRLSFLQGNYVTLTNMSDHDIDRICRYHLSPINISFQTMNPELRCKMLNNRFAGDALKKVDILNAAGIRMNGQIVLCKGVNDGKELEYSIRKLMEYLPNVESVSVVPVGLSRYREGLYPLEPFNAQDAGEIIDLIEKYQKICMEKYGTHFIQASDEWYILAGREVPEEERYDGYLQLENGVGMIRLLLDEFHDGLKRRTAEKEAGKKPSWEGTREISLATGRLAFPYLKKMSEEMMSEYPGLQIHVYEVINEFFGELITVSGLLTGQDIVKQIRSLKSGTQIVIGTPGRVMDHMRRKTMKLDFVHTVVLDEADEMLNMGFREDIEFVLSGVPEERQTVLFSATMPKPIMEITKKFQNNAKVIKVTKKELTVPNIEQYYYDVKPKKKEEVLSRLLDIYSPRLSVVFCNTKKQVDLLVNALLGRGYFAAGLHGDMKQEQRDRVMQGFRTGKTEILVATDVAARGIDVDEVEAVFNYDLPQDDEYYVHRIGRTGRAGREGRAFSFVSGKEVYKLKEIQRYCKTKIYAQKVPSLNDVANTKMENILDDVERVIEQEDLDMMINAIEERVNNSEFTAMDMAAAFLKICCGMTEDNKTTKENDWEFGDTGAGEDGMVRLFINIGKKQRVRPGDILGAIAGESGMDGKLIGTIDMYDKYTFVEVPREYAREVLNAMKNVKIKGKTVAVEPANQK